MGVAALAGLTLGAVSGAASLYARNKERKEAQKTVQAQTQEAQRQMVADQQNAVAAAAAREDAVKRSQERMSAAVKAFAADTGGSGNAFRGVYSSPLGDNSEPNIGRSRLLGN